MIEITVLKVHHYGEEEARKLLPYILACDVFGPEQANQSEYESAVKERDWEELINSGKSLSWFRKNVTVRIAPDTSQGFLTYDQKMLEYLFRNKKLIWHPERFSEEESKHLDELHLRQTELAKKAYVSLLARDIEAFLDAYRPAFEMRSMIADVRDKHIAKNLEASEKMLRQRFSALTDLEKIKYTIFMGSNHQVELYASVCKPVGLIEAVEDEIASNLRANNSADSRKDLLLLGLHDLMEQRRIEETDLTELKTMSFEELVNFVKT